MIPHPSVKASEMRIHAGPGYRVYYGRIRQCVYLLLCAENKSTQRCDIKQAIALLKKLERCSMKKTAPFDAADYLDNDEVIAEYLNAALEDPNPDVFLVAVADVAKARGMSQLAKDTGLGRESLYKALAPGAKPRYDTVLKLVRALGVQLHASAVHK